MMRVLFSSGTMQVARQKNNIFKVWKEKKKLFMLQYHVIINQTKTETVNIIQNFLGEET